MNVWLLVAFVFVSSHVASGWYWHRDGYQEAIRDAKAAQDDAVVAGIEAANELSRKDLERAIAAERKRGDQRVAANQRSAGLQESIRTQVVYRDRDCRIPDADRLRINDALQAAAQAGAAEAGGRNGAVPRAERDGDGGSGGDRGETAGDGGSTARVLKPTP